MSAIERNLTKLSLLLCCCVFGACGPTGPQKSFVIPERLYFSPCWGANGVIVFLHTPLDRDGRQDIANYGIYQINSDGTNYSPLLLYSEFGPVMEPVWSPDALWIALSGADLKLYKFSPESHAIVALTPNTSLSVAGPTWSPDGQLLACYASGFNELQDQGIYWVGSDGGPLHRLGPSRAAQPTWSPAGPFIGALLFRERVGFYDLALLDPSTGVAQIVLRPSRASEYPRFSPDGTRIIFDTPAEYLRESTISIVNRDGSNLRTIVNDGGVFPAWSPDGSEVVYVKEVWFNATAVGNQQLWIIKADGTNRRQLTFD